MDSLLQKSWAYAVGTLPDWIWPACASPVVRATGSNAASADCSLRKQLWIYLLGIKCPSQLGNWTFLSLKDHISSKTHCASRPYCSSSYGCQESCSTYPQINTKTLNLMLHRSVSVSVWQQLHSWINISFYNTFPGYKWSYWKNQATAAALCCHPVPACVLSIHTCSGDYQRVCSHIPHVSALISYFFKNTAIFAWKNRAENLFCLCQLTSDWSFMGSVIGGFGRVLPSENLRHRRQLWMKVPPVLVLLIAVCRKPLHTSWEAEDEHRIISFARQLHLFYF